MGRAVRAAGALWGLLAAMGWLWLPGHAGAAPNGNPPNILFIILDDVGRDQLKIFNPDADHPAPTPNIDAIAAAGVKFTNVMAIAGVLAEPLDHLHRALPVPHRC